MDTSFEKYEELMEQIYPSSLKAVRKGREAFEIWVDTPATWKKLTEFTKSEIIGSLVEQIQEGKRRFKDTKSGTYKI